MSSLVSYCNHKCLALLQIEQNPACDVQSSVSVH